MKKLNQKNKKPKYSLKQKPMKFEKNCKQNFVQVKNGDFLLIIAEEQKKKGNVMLPLKYNRLIVKVVNKKKHVFMRFPKELSGNSYNEESLINKIVESLDLYDIHAKDKKKFFSKLPQNYLIKAITPIKRNVIEKAFKRKQQHLQIQMNTIQKSINKLDADLKKSKILSWSIPAGFPQQFFYFKFYNTKHFKPILHQREK